MRAGFFLEDLGHQLLIENITKRIIKADESLDIHVFNSTGGDSLGKFYQFLKEYQRSKGGGYYDLLVVASDANKGGLAKRRRELNDKILAAGYSGYVCLAILYPNIERWYLADPQALARAAGIPVPAEEPIFSRRLGVEYYKRKLREI